MNYYIADLSWVTRSGGVMRAELRVGIADTDPQRRPAISIAIHRARNGDELASCELSKGPAVQLRDFLTDLIESMTDPNG